jgi:hypothetical protein
MHWADAQTKIWPEWHGLATEAQRPREKLMVKACEVMLQVVATLLYKMLHLKSLAISDVAGVAPFSTSQLVTRS